MSQTIRTVDDFVLRLVDSVDGGKHLDFASEAEGRLAGFPFWDHADRDLRHFIHSDIPLGTPHEPFEDRDESWGIAIFEHGGWVYVAEMDGHDSISFRVPTDRYLAVWRALIDRFNPGTPLEDLFDDSEVQ